MKTFKTDIGDITVHEGAAKLNDHLPINYDSALYHIGRSLDMLPTRGDGSVNLTPVYMLVNQQKGVA